MIAYESNIDLTFRTSEFAKESRLEEWQASMSKMYYALDIAETDNFDLDARLKVTDLSDVSIVDFRSSPAKGYRKKSDISKNTEEYFVFVFVTKGMMYYNQMARCGTIERGQYVMLRSGEAYELSCLTHSCAITVHLPVSLLETRYRLAHMHCGRAFDNHASLFPMVRSVVGSIGEMPQEARQPLMYDLRKQALDLILLLLRGERVQIGSTGSSGIEGLLTRLFNHIENNFMDTELNARSTAITLGVSVSHLHRALSSCDTTFGKTLQKVRLARAYEMLSSANPSDRSVSEIAYRVGFLDQSYFSKLFRETFNERPTDIKKLGLGGS